VLVGLLFGALGSMIDQDARTGLATLAASIGTVIGAMGLAGRSPRLLQRDHETPQRWLDYGPGVWSLLNGTVLGLGMFTRIGFWLWYVVPLGSLLVGEPRTAAYIYGAYGAMRGVASGALAASHRWGDTSIEDWLIGHHPQALFVGHIVLFSVGLLGVVAIGL